MLSIYSQLSRNNYIFSSVGCFSLQEMEKLINKICEMANVMQKSVTVDEDASVADREKLTQLEIENKGLRELLEICSTGRFRILEDGLEAEHQDKSIQADGANEKQETEEDEKSGERTPQNVDQPGT